MMHKFTSLVMLATMVSAVLAIPTNGGATTTLSSTSTSTVSTTTPSSTSTSTVPTTTPSTTVLPTTRPAGGPCAQPYPAGSSWVGEDGTTTSQAPTVYATWGPPQASILPVAIVVSDGTVTAGSATYTSFQGIPTSAGAYVIAGAAIPTSAFPTNGTVTITATPHYPTPTTTGPSGAPAGAITTVYPDATNGGVYLNTTMTYSQSGGGSPITVSTTGWFWPTDCSVGATATTSISATPTTSPPPADNTAGAESLNLGAENGAMSIGVSTLSLGAVVAIVASLF